MFQVFIDDEEVICESNFEIQEEFMNPSHIELYKVYPKSWKGTNKLLTDYYFPKDYTKCKILKDGELYFIGIVKNSADIELNPLKPHYCSLQILDMATLLSEGETLEYVIVNKTIEEAIKQVIESISDYGFVVGNILIPSDKNMVIGAYSTLDKAPFDVFQYFSLISGTRWGTRMIDENTTAIDFFSPELLENLGTIDLEKEYCSKNKITDVTFNYSTSDYRNKHITTSSEVVGNVEQNELIVANGYQNSFATEQKIGKIISIRVNGNYAAYATKNAKEWGATADFYYESGRNVIETETVYPLGTNIIIDYIPIIKGREISYNNLEISRISNNLGRNGTISRYEDRNDATTIEELQAISDTYIKFKGIAENTLNIVSRKDFLILGGKYKLNSSIAELNTEYIVKSKKTSIHQAGDFLSTTYEYELTNSFDLENELNYFDNQRSRVNGNISKDEVIDRNIDIENTANIIFSNLKIKEIKDVSNTLSGVLQILLIEPEILNSALENSLEKNLDA